MIGLMGGKERSRFKKVRNYIDESITGSDAYTDRTGLQIAKVGSTLSGRINELIKITLRLFVVIGTIISVDPQSFITKGISLEQLPQYAATVI